MYKKILVPVDGSKRAEMILSHVEALALHHNAKIIFLTVFQPSKQISHDKYELKAFGEQFKQLRQKNEAYLKGLAGEFREKGIMVQTHVTTGRIVKEIMDFADKEDVDLIAMCSHGRGGLTRLFYGSVAAGLLSRADRPLLIVRCRNVDRKQ